MSRWFDADETKARLSVIGAKLRIVDNLILALIGRRMELAGQVAWTKSRRRDSEFPNGEPISRPEVEEQRLRDLAVRAPEYGVDPNLARTILSILIDHSCKQQMILWQKGTYDYGEFTYKELKQNLLELTELVAARYRTYDAHFPATASYRQYELEVIGAEIDRLTRTKLCLDLGCAVGVLTAQLAASFDQVVGVDISPHMIEQAQINCPDNVNFRVADFEKPEFWETIADKSCDLLVMGLGTASDIRDMNYVMSQIDRVLCPQGRFVLSFYNADGLINRWPSQPWTPSLAATFDASRSCVDVHAGSRTLSVYAHAYTGDEIDELVRRGLSLTNLLSYPTLSSILPREILEDPTIKPLIEAVDRERAVDSDGAYLIAAGRKS